MAGPKKVSQKEYDEKRAIMEKEFRYDEQPDEYKARLDEEFDRRFTVEDKPDNIDNPDDVQNKDDVDDGHPPAPEAPDDNEHEDDDDLELE